MEIGTAVADFWAPEEAVAFARMIIAENIHFPELAQTSLLLVGILHDVLSSSDSLFQLCPPLGYKPSSGSL